MSDVRERYGKLFGRGEGTDRMQFFSDAVFAIALTLLVLDIRLPETEPENLLPALLALWPQYFAFGLSFVIIALNWISHHAKYRVIVRFDGRLLRLNFVLLFLIAIVPFPTSVLSEYGAETPVVVLYAATVAALSITQLLIWALCGAGRADLEGCRRPDVPLHRAEHPARAARVPALDPDRVRRPADRDVRVVRDHPDDVAVRLVGAST